MTDYKDTEAYTQLQDLNVSDFTKYVDLAIRTESPASTIAFNVPTLVSTLAIFIAAGNMLDQVKKHMFYGSDYDLEKYGKTMAEHYVDIVNALDYMRECIKSPNEAEETAIDPTELNPRLIHSLLGIGTESTEIVEALQSYLEGKPLDIANVFEEFGDLNWYEAICLDEFEGDMTKILQTNIEKLMIRFPDKFSQEYAEERNLSAERELLEQAVENDPESAG